MTLYFRRADGFDDLCECMPPEDFFQVVQRSDAFGAGVGPHQWLRFCHHTRSEIFLNCWHLSQHESYAMWKLYAGVDAGIAIKSTFRRLKDVLQMSQEHCGVGLTNYDTSHLEMNAVALAMYKRPHFQYESEVRAMVWRDCQEMFFDMDSSEPLPEPLPARAGPLHVKVRVEIACLIDEVVLAPWSPPYLGDVLHDIMKAYDFKPSIRVSTINKLFYAP